MYTVILISSFVWPAHKLPKIPEDVRDFVETDDGMERLALAAIGVGTACAAIVAGHFLLAFFPAF